MTAQPGLPSAARIKPGDIDLVCSGDGALGLGAIFADAIIEPVVHYASSPISDYWGRAFLTARSSSPNTVTINELAP